MWFLKFGLVNAKTALAVISESCVMIQPLADLSPVFEDVLHVKWHDSLVIEDQLYVYITLANINCLIAALITGITLFRKWKRISCARAVWVFITKKNNIVFASFEAVFIFYRLCEHSVYNFSRHIVLVVNNIYFRAHRLSRILLIGIQMLIKEATKKDRLRQVFHKETLLWHFALEWVQCEKN